MDGSSKKAISGFKTANIHFVSPWNSPTMNLHRRHLPHLSATGASYFVTFRCHRGLCIPEQARHEVLSAILHWNGGRIDVDAAVVMPDHVHIIFRLIREPKVAVGEGCGVNEEGGDKLEVRHAADKLEARPTLDCEMREEAVALSKIMHSIKSFSANRVNRLAGRKGAFWLHENFDHIIRDECDWREKVLYIMENPVRKGLADNPESYEWLWKRKDIFENDGSCVNDNA